MCENTSCYVTPDQRGCVHGDAAFHHDIVLECLCIGKTLLSKIKHPRDDVHHPEVFYFAENLFGKWF